MESMINFDGAQLIFATSFGYWDHMLKVAAKYPDVQFLHAAPSVWEEGMPVNAGSYNGYIDQSQYIAGVVAGHATKSGKLGFVAAKPYPASIRNVNSFTLGARTVNPDATMQVVVTGDWVLPVKEAEAVNSLADQGIDVVTCHVDAPKVVIETAEKRGIYSSGYHTDQSVLAPNGYLTGAIWNWEKVYTDYVTWLREGTSWPHILRGGLKEGIVTNVPLRQRRVGRGAERRRRRPGRLHGRELPDLFGADDHQRRPNRNSGRHVLRRERPVARDHGLVRRGRGRDDRRVTIPNRSREQTAAILYRDVVTPGQVDPGMAHTVYPPSGIGTRINDRGACHTA